jgi:TrmH family RNA methyltransferase
VNPAEPTVTSAANPRVRWLKSLDRPRERRREGVAVAEGLKTVAELVPLAERVVHLFWSEACEQRPDGAALLAAFRARNVPMDRVAPALLERLADTRNPQGVLAVVRTHPVALDAVLGGRADLLVLEGVQDPGNLGTLVRTVEAVGGAGIVLAGATADPTGPKCVRAAAGSLFRVPYVIWPDPPDGLAERIRSAGYRVGIASPSGAPLAEVLPEEPVAWVLGAEGAGVSEAFRRRGSFQAAIPMAAGVDSLNVAVAGSVLLYARRLAGREAPQQASMQRNTDSSRPRPQ